MVCTYCSRLFEIVFCFIVLPSFVGTKMARLVADYGSGSSSSSEESEEEPDKSESIQNKPR